MISLVLCLAQAQALDSSSPERIGDYHGFVQHSLKSSGLDAVVVEPKKAAKGRPWIWRLEFFDHRPMVDLALLERGFTLVHLEVGNTFGAPGAMAQFSQFYKELTGPRWKLNRRVVLEGFSRGGLYAYNWAVRNPDKVMAIYGDAPVCDFRTWPYGGQGAKRSEEDWNSLVQLYGFPSEKEALAYPFNPVDNLAVLAKARIPLIHVIGDADEVVPVAANTNLVEQRYKGLGGTIDVIHKPGGLHHPHSLDNPEPVVRFLLKHQRDSEHASPAPIIATPNPESRYNSAGWNGRSWLDQHRDGQKAAAVPDTELVLLGDSITQGFGGPLRQVSTPGEESYRANLAGFHTANEGISGDRVQNLIWRVENGALKDSPAKVVTIMIGVNNSQDDQAKDVVRGILELTRLVHRVLPKAQVLVQPLMPAGVRKVDALRVWTDEVNSGLRDLSKRQMITLAFENQDYLLRADGSQNPNFMAGDGIHLQPKGYDAWGSMIHRIVRDALARINPAAAQGH
jgi:lysophospholipase L1-like esterase/pimeloyl-ACP methyl ester carboxylesterase